MSAPEASEIIGRTDLERWRALCSAAGSGHPFSNEGFVIGIARALGWDVVPAFVESGGEEAGALFIRRRRGPLAQVVVPPFSPYTALILPAAADIGTRSLLFRRILDAAADVARDATIVLSPESAVPDPNPLPEPWSSDLFQTYRSGTGSAQDVIGDWSSSTRRTFRRNREEFERVIDTRIVPDILGHLETAYGHHGRPLPVPRAQLHDLAASMIDAGHAEAIGVRRLDTGAVEAGVVTLVAANRAWYWIAGSLPGPAMTVCIGHVLARCHDRGIHSFDFMGANTPSIAEFKRRFGGDLVEYPVFRTPRRPLNRIASGLRRLLPGGGES